MTPIEITRGIIREIAEEFQLTPARILSRERGKTVYARIAIAKALEARGYTGSRIAKILNRDRDTIIFYLGRKKHQPTKPKWKAPRVLYSPKGMGDLKGPRPKLYLVPYAGADVDYVWQRREKAS